MRVNHESKINSAKSIICALLVLALCFMMFFIVYMLNIGQSQVGFDLSTVTSEQTEYPIDVSKFIIPEFIGITYGGEKLGCSGSENILGEMYRELSGVISEVLCDGNIAEGSRTDWSIFAESKSSVYIRYHSELPDCAVGYFADEASGNVTDRRNVTSYIYEMYIIPNTDGSGKVDIAVKSKGGDVCFYSGTPESILTGDGTAKMLDSYRSGMYEYKMSGGQPVFTENISTRNILITGGTAALIQTETNDETKNEIIRFFGLNPDKLLSSHIDEEGMDSYVDTHGSLYIKESGIEYNSSSDGGVGIYDFIGDADEISLGEYIKASVSMITYMRSVNKNIAGGDAEIYLYSVTSQNGKVKLEFMYAFDGIRIMDLKPAFTAEFEDGILRRASLYSISVKYFSERRVLMLEDSFIEIMKSYGKNVTYTNIVYRSDFLSESVGAEWQCVEYQQ